ncbi:MAG: site-specific integrase [Lentisphaeria bacterium]|nr:site-specific integrase [Lentisphaeria bacterium]
MGTRTRPLTEAEFSRYLLVINDPPPPMLPSAAVCAFLLGSGARISEALGLRFKDVFLNSGEPKGEITRTVSKKKDKGKLTPSAVAAVRRFGEAFGIEEEEVLRFMAEYPPPAGKRVRLTVPFPWEAVGKSLTLWGTECRRRFLIRPEELLFSARWTRRAMNRRSVLRANRRLLEIAGVDPDRVGLHGLRKTFLRKVLKEELRRGTDKFDAIRKVQRLAGHVRIETTLLYLRDEIEGDLADALCRAFADVRPECATNNIQEEY